jgi:hypothetical protein
MNATATLRWSEDSPAVEIKSRADLEERLRDLDAKCRERPIVAIVAFADETYAYVGLGGEGSMLFLHGRRDARGLTPEWVSVGDENRRGHTPFFTLGHHNDYENRSLLRTPDAIRGLGEIFETRQRPGWIRWEENAF